MVTQTTEEVAHVQQVPDKNDQDAVFGVKKLANLERVLLKRRILDEEAPGCCYEVLSLDQTLVLKVDELGDAHPDNGRRAFKIVMTDSEGKEVVRLIRPKGWMLSKMLVSVLGRPVAIVRQKPAFFDTVLLINDTDDLPMLRIKGEFSTTDYRLQTACRKKRFIGRVTKMTGGVLPELSFSRDDY